MHQLSGTWKKGQHLNKKAEKGRKKEKRGKRGKKERRMIGNEQRGRKMAAAV